MSNDRIVIIGNGISGITAARHIRKRSDARITVIGKESEHFFSRTALMYLYMGHMRYRDIKPYEDHFWAKNRIALKHATVARIDTEKNPLC
ncbi:MAG: FAD-dependent oxidoreductase [Flavobacteriales bacterium]